MVKPPRLKPGDLVRIVAPGSQFDRERFDRGVASLTEMGFRVAWREDIFAKEHYLAGSDARRAEELAEAFSDPDTRGIVCARGGYGSPRILKALAFARLVKTPKVFVGFSDMTALLLAFARAGMVAFHGPMSTGRMATEGLSAADRDSFLRAVGTAAPAGLVGKGETWVDGSAEGPLVGGNLALVGATLGTPYFPDTKGAILFLEDVGENPFRLDRLVTQLDLAGVLANVAGIALGRFSNCKHPDPAITVEKVLRELFERAGKPCVWGLPFGHEGENRTLPVGVRARLGDGALEIVEAAVT